MAEPLRVVFDPNVLVSAAIAMGAPRSLVDLAAAGVHRDRGLSAAPRGTRGSAGWWTIPGWRSRDRLLAFPIAVGLSRPLISEAWMYRHNVTIHDAAYVVLAAHLNAPLLTSDQKLASAPNLPIQILHLSVAE